MKINCICFTLSGMNTAARIRDYLSGKEELCEDLHFYAKGNCFNGQEDPFCKIVSASLRDWTEKAFSQSDCLIFVGAVGIAVRAIAPFIKDKRQDPAVIVFDEKGTFGIPILSGHIGGANAFASELCEALGSTPVITTSTDINNRFAVDVYASENNLMISSMTYAKEISAALLSGDPVGFYGTFPVDGELPEGIYYADKMKRLRKAEGLDDRNSVSLGFVISPFYDQAPFHHTLWLIPKCVTLGIGCRKGTSMEKIAALIKKVLEDHCIFPEAVKEIATIDIKKNEEGLVNYCLSERIRLRSFSAKELKAVKGEFSASPFVWSVTGVDNVCERSAVAASGGKILVTKTTGDGVTCAAALSDWRIVF